MNHYDTKQGFEKGFFMSKITEFICANGKTDENRTREQLLASNNRFLELSHLYIQWLFPLTEASEYNPATPVLTEEDIETIKNSVNGRNNILTSFMRMLSFYGYRMEISDEKDIRITIDDNSVMRRLNWLRYNNHNFLRITRILKCLMLFNLDAYAMAFFHALQEEYKRKEQMLAIPYTYWETAVEKE